MANIRRIGTPQECMTRATVLSLYKIVSCPCAVLTSFRSSSVHCGNSVSTMNFRAACCAPRPPFLNCWRIAVRVAASMRPMASRRSHTLLSTVAGMSVVVNAMLSVRQSKLVTYTRPSMPRRRRSEPRDGSAPSGCASPANVSPSAMRSAAASVATETAASTAFGAAVASSKPGTGWSAIAGIAGDTVYRMPRKRKIDTMGARIVRMPYSKRACCSPRYVSTKCRASLLVRHTWMYKPSASLTYDCPPPMSPRRLNPAAWSTSACCRFAETTVTARWKKA
mmetsp:Transcript_53526/g.164600  ORF Transcript_53526/g.164600 Transcript_53526/m.164600 type:complete len:280 (-) Transcript_53526:527-1366(-)